VASPVEGGEGSTTPWWREREDDVASPAEGGEGRRGEGDDVVQAEGRYVGRERGAKNRYYQQICRDPARN